MADVFISYSSKDRAVAARLAEALSLQGLSVWWDRRIAPGEENSDAARYVITLWSKNSRGSRWVRDEAAAALADRKLISLEIEDDVKLPLQFRAMHTISIAQWLREGAAELPTDLRYAIGLEAGTTAAPTSLIPGYQMDLTICIDANSSLRTMLNVFKRRALNLASDIEELSRQLTPPKEIVSISVRIVTFSTENGLFSRSRVFDLPREESEYAEHVLNLDSEPPTHSGERSTALPALDCAIRSRWPPLRATARRQIVALWTNVDLSEGEFPGIGSASISELALIWGDEEVEGLLEYPGKSMILWAPAGPGFSQISDSFENVIHYEADPERQLENSSEAWATFIQQLMGSV